MLVTKDNTTLEVVGGFYDLMVQRKLASLVSQIDSQNQSVQKQQREIVEKSRELQALMSEAALVKQSIDPIGEVSRIQSINKIENVWIGEAIKADPEVSAPEGKWLCAYTTPIWTKDPRTNRKHRLGRYKLAIRVTEQKTTYGMYALDYRVRAFENIHCNSPHAFSDGSSCLGTAERTIEQLIAAGDLFGLVLTLIAFLEQVNTDDESGAHIHKWPYVEQEAPCKLNAVQIVNRADIKSPAPPITDTKFDTPLLRMGKTKDQFVDWIHALPSGEPPAFHRDR